MNHHQCYFHKDNRIVKFCALKQCTLPLCQICQPIHCQEHQNSNTKSQIISFLSAHSKAVSELTTLITDFKNQKQSVSASIFKQKEAIINIIEKHYQQKFKGFNQSVKLFEELQTKLTKIKKGSLKTLIMFFAQDPNYIRHKLKLNITADQQSFNQKQRDFRIQKFESFLQNLYNQQMHQNQKSKKPASKEIDDIIFANQETYQVNQKALDISQKHTLEQKRREYDQRIYRQIKQQMSKQKQDNFKRDIKNEKNSMQEKRNQTFKVNQKGRQTFHDLQKVRDKYQNYPSSHSKAKYNDENTRKDISQLSPIGRQSSNKKYQIEKHISSQMRQIRTNPGMANKYENYGNKSENPHTVQLKTYEDQSLSSKVHTYHHSSLNSYNGVASQSANQKHLETKLASPLTFENRYKQSKEMKFENSNNNSTFKMQDLLENPTELGYARTKSYSEFSQGYNNNINSGYKDRDPLALRTTQINNSNNIVPTVPIQINPRLKFDYEKLSKEVLSPQQIRKMLQKRIDDRTKVIQTKLSRVQDRNDSRRNLPIQKFGQNREHVSSYPVYRNDDRSQFFLQRREADTKDSIINQIYADSRY